MKDAKGRDCCDLCGKLTISGDGFCCDDHRQIIDLCSELDAYDVKLAFAEVRRMKSMVPTDVLMDERTEIDSLRAKLAELESWAQGVIDYESIEVCKDEFAYDRLVKTMKDAARRALGLEVDS